MEKFSLDKINRFYEGNVLNPASGGLYQLLHLGDRMIAPFRQETLPRVTVKAGSAQGPQEKFLEKALEPIYLNQERRLGRPLFNDERKDLYQQYKTEPELYLSASHLENQDKLDPKGLARTKALKDVSSGLVNLLAPFGDKFTARHSLKYGFKGLLNPRILDHFDPERMRK